MASSTYTLTPYLMHGWSPGGGGNTIWNGFSRPGPDQPQARRSPRNGCRCLLAAPLRWTDEEGPVELCYLPSCAIGRRPSLHPSLIACLVLSPALAMGAASRRARPPGHALASARWDGSLSLCWCTHAFAPTTLGYASFRAEVARSPHRTQLNLHLHGEEVGGGGGFRASLAAWKRLLVRGPVLVTYARHVPSTSVPTFGSTTR